MPYPYGKRQRYYGRRRYPRRRYQRRNAGGSAWSTASRALSLATKVASMVNSEEKIIDATLSNYNIPNSGSLVVLNQCSQGDTDTTRDGDSIKMKNHNMRISLSMNPTGTTARIRLIVFMWKNASSAPVVTSILEAADVLSPKNQDLKYQSKILHDKVFQLDSSSDYSAYCDFFTDFKGPLGKYSHVQYNAASGTINTNGMYILMLSDQATLTPAISYYSRVQFYDN